MPIASFLDLNLFELESPVRTIIFGSRSFRHPEIFKNERKKLIIEELHILQQKIVILFRELYKYFSEKINIAKKNIIYINVLLILM